MSYSILILLIAMSCLVFSLASAVKWRKAGVTPNEIFIAGSNLYNRLDELILPEKRKLVELSAYAGVGLFLLTLFSLIFEQWKQMNGIT